MIIFIVTVILILDRLSKVIASTKLVLHQSVPLLKGILHFTLVHNQGAAFGVFKGQLFLLIITTLFAVGLIVYYLKTDAGTAKGYVFSLALILAGALGNLIDRVFFGYVIDFIDFRIWPVFNVADSAITIGAVLLGWKLLRSPSRDKSPGHKVTRSPGQKH